MVEEISRRIQAYLMVLNNPVEADGSLVFRRTPEA